MADNVTIDEGTGVPVAADEIAGVKHQRVKIQHGADGSATDVSTASPLPATLQGVSVKAASTAAQDTDTGIVVHLHPRSTNANGSNSRGNSAPVNVAYEEYETVAASQTDQVMGATGAVGDILAYILVIPVTTAPGPIDIKDGNGSAIRVFEGGTGSVGSLIPFPIPWNARAANATTAGWKISTGANVRAIAFGDFT